MPATAAPACLTFDEALDVVDRLAIEDQVALVDIVRRRIAEQRREELVARVLEAERELAEGHCKAATVDEIMREILS
jgi:hypothetical protein